MMQSHDQDITTLEGILSRLREMQHQLVRMQQLTIDRRKLTAIRNLRQWLDSTEEKVQLALDIYRK